MLCWDPFESTNRQATASHGGFGAGGLAFQLGHGNEDDSEDDDDVDHDLITVRAKKKNEKTVRN